MEDTRLSRRRDGKVSSRCFFTFGRKEAAVFILGLAMMVFLKDCIGAAPHKDYTSKVGDEVKIPLGSSGGRELHIWNVESQRFERICNGRECDEPLVYRIDGEDTLHFTANEKTAGNYTLTDFDTNEIVFSFRLKLQNKSVDELSDGLTETKKWTIGLSVGALFVISLIIAVVVITIRRCRHKRRRSADYQNTVFEDKD